MGTKTFLKCNKHRWAGVIAYSALAIASLLPYSFSLNQQPYILPKWLFILVGAGFALFDFFIIHEHRQKDIAKSTSDFTRILETELKVISENLKLTHQERVSLYKYDKGIFILKARYSESVDLRKSGRPAYGEKEGIIGQAFEWGFVFVTNLPDYSTQRKEYLKEVSRKYSISSKTLKNLKMKSRSLTGRVIKDARGEKIGVIIIESLNKDFTHLVQDNDESKVLDSDRIKNFFERECNRLRHYFELVSQENSILLAYREGV